MDKGVEKPQRLQIMVFGMQTSLLYCSAEFVTKDAQQTFCLRLMTSLEFISACLIMSTHESQRSQLILIHRI
jgi:hypothetical protein